MTKITSYGNNTVFYILDVYSTRFCTNFLYDRVLMINLRSIFRKEQFVSIQGYDVCSLFKTLSWAKLRENNR